MADVKRNLEAGGGLFVNKWWTGMYQNRSPLYTPVSAMGLQLISRQDALWDGLNMQITPQFTLRRRYGFSRYCSAVIGASEHPLTFFSFEDLSGIITPIMDTSIGWYTFGISDIINVYTKTSGAGQTSFNSVGDILYFCDGKNSKKWDGTTVSNMGITAGGTAPTLYNGAGTLSVTDYVQYGYCYLNPTSGHISTMSPASSQSASPINSLVTENDTVPGSGPLTITVASGASWVLNVSVTYTGTTTVLTPITGTPTTGQYNISASGGTYTFSSGDASANVTIVYYTGSEVILTGPKSTDPQVTTVQIYRTDDGGSIYYYVGDVPNPSGSIPWSYTDELPDSGLNTDLIAPQAEANNPPPTGMSLLTWYAGRLWGASGNTLYYSGGPDTLNGSGEESWPPANNFTLPGSINALAATSSGLIIWTKDNAYATLGTTSATFTVPQTWQANWGVRTQNQVCQDGDNLFVFTSQGQVFNYSSTGLEEIGFLEEEQLGAFNTTTSYIAIHRSGPDEGIFISDGSANIYRYSQVSSSWDCVIQPQGGVGAIVSMEMPDAKWHLLMGRPTNAGYILTRDLTVWTDDSETYPAFVTVGSITVAPPRQVANLSSVLMQVTATGTYPTVAVMLNEIQDVGTVPATFTNLPNPVPDPPNLPPSRSIWTRRHDFKAAQTPLSGQVQHLQVRITFPSEAAGNEILGLGLD